MGRRGRAPRPYSRFLERSQDLPAVREVAGEEQHDEDANRLHRLDAHQVDLGVARAGAAAEGDQQQREQDRAEQGHIAQASDDRALEIDRGDGGQNEAAGGGALGEADEQHRVAHRVAQADHHHEAEAAEQVDNREQPRVAARSPDAQPGVRRVEGEDQEARRPEEAVPEVGGIAHDEHAPREVHLLRGQQRHPDREPLRIRPQLVAPFDQPLAERRHPLLRRQILVGHHDRADGVDARHLPSRASRSVGRVEPGREPIGDESSFSRVGHDRFEPREQLLGAVGDVEVCDGASREAARGVGKHFGARGRDEPEPCDREDGPGEKAEEFDRAPLAPPGLGRGRTLGRGAVRHPHYDSAWDNWVRRFCTSSSRTCVTRIALLASPNPIALP